MRALVWCSLCFLLLSGVTRAQPDPLHEAEIAYARGDFAAAIGLYESALAAGQRHAAIYFNLGNAYYQAGDIGQALLNFRRTQRFIPRDPDLNANIALIRQQHTDLQGDDGAPAESLAALTSSVLTTSELGWGTWILWSLWFVLLAVLIRFPYRRGSLIPFLVILGTLVLAAALLLASRLWVSANRPSAVVVAVAVTVTSGPGESYLPLFDLHAAAEVRLLESRAGWFRFRLADGRQGWLAAPAVEQVEDEGGAGQ